MATMLLSHLGSTLFGPVGGFVGALAGQAADSALAGALSPTVRSPSRLDQLKVQTVTDGAPMARVWGRVKLAGQVIWTGDFRESVTRRRVAKAGPKVESRSYSLSFAIGLCEGPIAGIGRVWANGALLDMGTIAHRLLTGGEDQEPDPLLEARFGIGRTPAWRGMAVLVFEDLLLADFGDRLPNIQVEVFSQGSAANDTLAGLARGVCLIPGAGEFALATTPVQQVPGPGRALPENQHASSTCTDLSVALDQLQRDLPQVSSVSLVVSWFGDDLRAGACSVRPKVEAHGKATAPVNWSVSGLTRAGAAQVSQIAGLPAYGGTPSDASVLEAIAELKRRGLKVVLNPFVMMDIPAGNTLPDPWGGQAQAVHPWRGRITCDPAPGRPGSPDGSALAASQINAFFGTVTAAHFLVSGGQVSYSGPAQWSYSRCVLHLAALARAAGGVDAFLLGSELVGLTRVRDGAGASPAVACLQALAGDVRQLLGPSVRIGYGADWTEYGAQTVPGAPDDLWFPLDPLWADANTDFIGIDWYAPIADQGPDDPPPDLAALQARVASGEGHDWFYADEVARLARSRTPITDGAHQEPWVYRQKDLKSWWSRAHHPRTGGVRASTATDWVPQSKPVWLMELGFPAVDRAANRPSVFPDPKSSESGLPPFSSGARDDHAQRLALEASIGWWMSGPTANPVSTVYGGPMVDVSRIHLWCWDARPWPWFPGLGDVWTDGAWAERGHWLMGRVSAGGLDRVVADLCAPADLPVDTSALAGLVDGLVLMGPQSVQESLEPLVAAHSLMMNVRDGRLVWRTTPAPVAEILLDRDDLVFDHDQALAVFDTTAGHAPASLTLNGLSPATLEPASLTAFASEGSGGASVDLPLVLAPDAARATAGRLLLAARSHRESLQVQLAPAVALRLEPGDRVSLPHIDRRVWQVSRLEGGLARQATLVPAGAPAEIARGATEPGTPVQAPARADPVLLLLDLPAGLHPGAPPAPAVATFANPWPGRLQVRAGGQLVASIDRPATLGTLDALLPGSSVGVTLAAPVQIAGATGVFPASGRAALMSDGQVADVIGWTGAVLRGEGQWALTGVHRGLNGAPHGPPLPAGSMVVLLDAALVAGVLPAGFEGVALDWTLHTDGHETAAGILPFSAHQHRPWPPCHVVARRETGGIRLGWVRRGNQADAGWGSVEPPLGAPAEVWHVELHGPGGAVVRVLQSQSAGVLYGAGEELADFGSMQSGLALAIAQLGPDGAYGPAWSGVVPVAA